MEEIHNRMKIAEQAMALHSPINEANHALNDFAIDSSALRIYNCLVPQI